MRRVAGLLGALTVLLLVVPRPANAATEHTQAPDENGNVGYCSATYAGGGNDANTLTDYLYSVRCQVPIDRNDGVDFVYARLSNNVWRLHLPDGSSGVDRALTGTPPCAPIRIGATGFSGVQGRFQYQQSVHNSNVPADVGRIYAPSWSAPPESKKTLTFYSNATCTTSVGSGVAAFQATTGATYPEWPPDYWTGGEGGDTTGAACFTYTPTSAPDVPATIKFDARCSTDRQGATFAWTFPANDNTGASTTGAEVQRTFTAAGLYDVTVEMTKNGVTSSYTQTVNVGDVEEDPGDTDCGSPLNIGKYIVCWLKRLFVPSGDALRETTEELLTNAQDAWPVAPAVWVIDTAAGGVDEISTGYAGPPPPGRVEGEGSCDYVALPIGGGQQIDLFQAPDCPHPMAVSVAPVATTVKIITSIAFIVTLVFGVLGAVKFATGTGGDG